MAVTGKYEERGTPCLCWRMANHDIDTNRGSCKFCAGYVVRVHVVRLCCGGKSASPCLSPRAL
jgi:hypothetical protein